MAGGTTKGWKSAHWRRTLAAVLAAGWLAAAGAAAAQDGAGAAEPLPDAPPAPPSGEPEGAVDFAPTPFDLGAEGAPALITADELTYNEQLGTVTASGSVEIVQGADVLLADSVSYNLDTEVVTAAGNVALLNENGDVYFSEYAELTGDLQEGFIRGIRVLMADGVTRVAAAQGIRTAGNRTVFRDTVYTPCEVCRENPDRAPLWQLSARKVIHDKEAREVRYRDATVDIFGVPVFYTPYFEHPDPTVTRQSGFLFPSFKSSDFLGQALTVPYFVVIDDNVDVTVSPTFTTNQMPVLNLEYRHLFPTGSIEVRGSGTIAEREESDGTVEHDAVRGHIDARGRFSLDSRWRTGFDVFRLTDDTYDQLYDVPVPETRSRVTTSAFVEGFGGRNYFAANTFTYQSLRSDEDDELQPIVVPEIDFSYVSDPMFADSYVSSDANLLFLTRQDGRQVARATLANGWTLPYTSDWGDVWTLGLGLQGDAYWTVGNDPDNPNAFDTQNEDSAFAGRLFPRASLQWRYPWSIQSAGWEQIVQPVAQLVVAPNGEWFNRGEIPNEDSLDFQFDDTTLFAPNRFPGYDRVDPGSRFDYGLRWGLYTGSGTYSELFLGQSFRLQETDVFPGTTGLGEAGTSDIVGRALFQPFEELYTAYRFRYDEETLDASLHEVTAVAGTPMLRVSGEYTFVAGDGVDFDDRETVTFGASSRIAENWFASGSVTRDLIGDLTQTASFNVTYQDECFLLSVTAERRNFEDRDLEPDDRIFVTIGLAQLGQFGTTFSGANFGGGNDTE